MAMSVSGLAVAGRDPKRSTRTSAEVVCGTKASRTVSMRNGVAVASTYTPTRIAASISPRTDAPSLTVLRIESREMPMHALLTAPASRRATVANVYEMRAYGPR